MVRAVRFLALLAFVVGVLPITAARASVFDPADYLEIVVEVNPDKVSDLDAYADYFLSQVGASEFLDQRIHHQYRYAIQGFSAYLTANEYKKATRLDLLASGELVSMTESTWGQFAVSPITDIAGQMPSTLTDPEHEVTPFGIQRIGLPAKDDYSGIDVAVIDTGVDTLHPDLNVVGGVDCTAAYGASPDYNDYYGHGTHVAGTIAAKKNGYGVVGVAPNARIWSVRVLDDSGSGSFASVLCGIDYVAEHGDVIDVANMSLGGGGPKTSCGGSDPMHNGICIATEKTVFVVAAGNSSADSDSFVPASYDEVITVSAFTDFDGQAGMAGVAPQNNCYAYSVDDHLASFSNYGPAVDIAATGVCVFSTVPSRLVGVGGVDPQFGYASGTSMATPHVAGCITRFLSDNPDQMEYAKQQLLTWSDANTDPVTGDPDGGFHEPLAYCAGIPRYEGSGSDYTEESGS